ncbi:hypothetical protein WJX74_004910 [Apatococcus lobatus]|uniref:BTB domain-containing protein n=1 Tax=Apatococcus lobatus TaxID=904363 RepID=A0AAW1QTJ0_9CHLO
MPPQVIKLNVGGEVFATTRHALGRTPGTFLADLVSEEAADKLLFLDGAIFIDRSPKFFQHILDELRGCTPCVPTETSAVLQLLQESRFYGLSRLSAALEDGLQPQAALCSHHTGGSQAAPGALQTILTSTDVSLPWE